MSSEGSVSQWIGELKAGDPAAAQKLWECYFQRLVGLARKKLQGKPCRVADEEDAALSAFDSFCRGAQGGRFPQLTDRDNLWRLLVAITARKAFQVQRKEHRQKRGGGAVRDEAVLAGSPESEMAIEQIIGREPTPEFAAQVAEEYERLLGELGDAELQAIALMKMEGATTDEIAAQLGCARSTVERRLRMICTLWKPEDLE
jgi:DNA-directed RNA polymerase specialized sigma24 family protein